MGFRTAAGVVERHLFATPSSGSYAQALAAPVGDRVD